MMEKTYIFRLALYIVPAACISVFATGCFKDLGNYDYIDINEAVIGNKGFETAYNIRINETLAIEPDITFTMDSEGSGDYAYEWVAVGQTLYRGERFTIGTERNLDYVMKLNADNYILYLKVTDIGTGIVYSRDVELNVMSPYSTGWLLAGEVDGKGQIDMMSISGDIIFYTGTLSMEDDTQLAPVSCVWVDNDTWTGDEKLYAGTAEGTYKLDRETFTGSAETELRYSFAIDPGDGRYDMTDIQQIRSENIGSIRVAAVINSRAHIISSEGGIIENSFSFYRDIDGNIKDFPVADRIICNHRQSSCRTMIFYNTEEREFCYISGLTVEGMKTPGDGENDEFSWKTKNDFGKDGLDFVYAVNSFFSNGQSAVILKEPSSRTYYIYCITANRNQPDIIKNGRYIVDNNVATGFGSSPSYAMTTNHGYMLYASGCTLYGYDFRKSPQRCSVLKTFDAPISYIMVDTETKEQYEDYIYVSTYDDTRSRSGILYKLQMVDSPDEIEVTDVEKWDNRLLKIIDMYYKTY